MFIVWFRCEAEPKETYGEVSRWESFQGSYRERSEEIEEEQKAYQYFTSLPVVQLKAYNESMLKIPLLYTESDLTL